MTGSHRTLNRNRYIATRIDSEKAFEGRDLFDAVWTSTLKLFGEFGTSQTGLCLIEYSPQTQQAIFRCSHKTLDLVKAAITAVTQIKDGKAVIHVCLISGTVRSLRRKVQEQRDN